MSVSSRRVKQFELDPQELEGKIAEAFEGFDEATVNKQLEDSVKHTPAGTIVRATVDSVNEETGFVVLDIGGKSEGAIALSEFGEDLPKTGDVFDVYYDGLNDDDTASLSKRRADRLRAWGQMYERYNEGDEVQGVVQRKIKGGLLVEVEGVNVFLPASQVNLRRTHDISDFIGEPIRARVPCWTSSAARLWSLVGRGFH